MLEWQPFPSPGDHPDTGIKPGSPALQADSYPSELPGKPLVFHLNLFHFQCSSLVYVDSSFMSGIIFLLPLQIPLGFLQNKFTAGSKFL